MKEPFDVEVLTAKRAGMFIQFEDHLEWFAGAESELLPVAIHQ